MDKLASGGTEILVLGIIMVPGAGGYGEEYGGGNGWFGVGVVV